MLGGEHLIGSQKIDHQLRFTAPSHDLMRILIRNCELTIHGPLFPAESRELKWGYHCGTMTSIFAK
jgi:hypothetical protein